jgi:hypothetical protein
MRHASLLRGQLGPQCVTGAGHELAGVLVPHFSAPDTGNFVDETLDVDLSFLALSNYSIFVVARRTADKSATGAQDLLGTTAPNEAEAACGYQTQKDRALQFGWVYYPGAPTLFFDHTCDGTGVSVPAASGALVHPFEIDETLFDASSGHQLWLNGNLMTTLSSTVPLLAASGGAIGRAIYSMGLSGTVDARLIGDIAEVLVFGSALSDGDRVAVEQYLAVHWNLN